MNIEIQRYKSKGHLGTWMLSFYQHTYSRKEWSKAGHANKLTEAGNVMAVGNPLPVWLHVAVALQMWAYFMLFWLQEEKFAPSLSHSKPQSVGEHLGVESLEAGEESRLFWSACQWPSWDKLSFRARTSLKFLQLQSRKCSLIRHWVLPVQAGWRLGPEWEVGWFCSFWSLTQSPRPAVPAPTIFCWHFFSNLALYK